jgi:uncharacterized protein (DUF934 family)
MPLIREGRLAEDVWTHAPDGAPLPAGPATVSLKRWLAEAPELAGRNAPAGVRLDPADDPAALAPHLSRLALIEVSFPRYTDGRGYSQAQLLRRRHGYRGELRAVGHVLRDQLRLMARAGFDAVVIDHPDPEGVWRSAVAEFSEAYQPAADGRMTVFEKRHAAARPAPGERER